MNRRVEHDGQQTLQIRFPFDRSLVERIKTLPNRRWNASERFWFVPESDVVLLVDMLADEGFEFDEATRALYGELGGSRRLQDRAAATATSALPLFEGTEPEQEAGAVSGTTDLSVGTLNQRVRELLAGAFPAPVWLVGEISGFNKSTHRKHVGFEMIERGDDGATVSRVSAILFDSTRREIERRLRKAGDPFRLEDEITVRFQVRVDLYAPWGQYRVVLEDLDIHYTLGEAARRREEIVRRLTADGLHEVNRSLELPVLPLRVGVITSLGSDAYNDVLRSFGESGYAFEITVHGARVQGQATEPSVLNALDWFAARNDRFDVLLICRGGGSRTDLVWFDTERLGRAVALFPVPVIVGIGHEQDQSVLDAVARSCKTPTAAAGVLVELCARALANTEETGRRILDRTIARLDLAHGRLVQFERQARSSARSALNNARERLSSWARRIPREAARRLDGSAADLTVTLRSITRAVQLHTLRGRDTLRRVDRGLGPAARRTIEHETERLSSRSRRLALVDPRRVVERGYAILRREDNSVLLDAAKAQRGESLVAELKHGRLGVTADKMLPDSNRE